jgi:YafQ family addiction module toxin component
MYNFDVEDKLQEILKKLSKKDSLLHKRVLKKIQEIVNSYDVESYKNLRHDMKDYKRVQIGHFVLVFRFDKVNNLIIFDDFDHHDRVY